jgi:hypothetical protein
MFTGIPGASLSAADGGNVGSRLRGSSRKRPNPEPSNSISSKRPCTLPVQEPPGHSSMPAPQPESISIPVPLDSTIPTNQDIAVPLAPVTTTTPVTAAASGGFQEILKDAKKKESRAADVYYFMLLVDSINAPADHSELPMFASRVQPTSKAVACALCRLVHLI